MYQSTKVQQSCIKNQKSLQNTSYLSCKQASATLHVLISVLLKRGFTYTYTEPCALVEVHNCSTGNSDAKRLFSETKLGAIKGCSMLTR